MDSGIDAMSRDEVATLLLRCAHADARAFQKLYERTNARLYAIALAITRQPSLADDVLHDAYMQAWKNADRYNPKTGSGWTWIVSLTRYRAIDAVNRAKREVTGVELPDVPDPQVDPLEPLASASEIRLMHRCLQGLENHPRRLLRMGYLGGMTHVELAKHVGHSLGGTKSVIRRALMQLRNCMGGTR